jgi:hypothetical protein
MISIMMTERRKYMMMMMMMVMGVVVRMKLMRMMNIGAKQLKK